MKNRFFFIIILILGLIILFTPVSSHAAPKNPLQAAGFLNFEEKRLAPDFMLKDVENNWVNLKEFQGKIVLLFFWTTW